MAEEFKHLEFAKRLNSLMDSKNLSIQDISDRTKINYEMVRRYTKGMAKPRDAGIEKLAKALGTTSAYLDYGQEPQSVLDQIRALDNVRVDYGDDDDSGDIRIPIYDVYFCCGDGDAEEFAFEEVKGERKFPPHFFTDKNVKPENFKLVCAKNDSQKPYINEHDMVGIDISDREIKDGEMYAILLDGERMFKRIFREPGNVLRLHCYNPDYPDKIVTAENHSSLVIVGREMYRAG